MASSSMSVKILDVVTQYSLYTSCFTIIAGIFGNALNILVFTQLKPFRDNRSAFYLTIESIFNFAFQFSSISSTILTSIYGDDATERSLVWCRFRNMFIQTVVLTTNCMTCLAAVDQFFSTNYRFNLRQICTMKLARCLTFTFVCVWIVHSIIVGCFFDIQPSFGCVISNSAWLEYSTFFYYPVLAGLLPIAIASSSSIWAFRNVRRIVRRQLPIVRRRLDQQMTAMVLMRVLLFVCLALPFTIYRIYNINNPFSRGNPMEYAIGRLIQTIFLSFVGLNYTVSFYVFMISSSRFRRQVKFVLVRRCWQRWKHWCCVNGNQVGPENIPSTASSNIELE